MKRYEIGSDSVVDNTTYPTLKAILKYRKHPNWLQWAKINPSLYTCTHTCTHDLLL